jgi:hypothetical protein
VDVLRVFWADNGIRTHSFDTSWHKSPESYTHTVKTVFRGHLWDTGKMPYKTGDVLKEVQFIWNFMTGQEKGDLLIQVTA